MRPQSIRVGHTSTSVPGFKNSVAFLSVGTQENIDRAVIFIHGFKGHADETWADFLSLVEDDATASRWWETADLYFLDYWWDSMFRKVSRNKFTVLRFINLVFPKPPKEMFAAAKVSLRHEFRYRSITLVGHSEGGLILRKVILDTAKKDADVRKYIEQFKKPNGSPLVDEPAPRGLLQARLRLFAPAIGGESVTGLLGVLVRSPIVSTFTGSTPAKLSMASSSSAVTSARASTNRYAEYLSMECFHAHILWADDDKIVEPEAYDDDVECEMPPRKSTHTSICKPTKDFLLPINFVEKGVEDGKC